MPAWSTAHKQTTPRRPSGWGNSDEDVKTSWRGVIRAILEVVPGGCLRAGKTAYTDDTNAGFWLGVDADTLAKLNIGNSSWWLHWTGSKLETNSDISFLTPAAIATEKAIKWLSGSTITTYLGAFLSASENTIRLFADALSGRDSTCDLWASAATGKVATVRGYAETASGKQGTLELIASDVYSESRIRLDADYTNVGSGLYIGDTSSSAGAGNVELTGVIKIDNQQVVTNRQTAITHLTVAGSAEDATARAAINAILTALEAHGLVAVP